MKDQKHTYEQIISALEIRMPHDAICREAYDLINRQRAEIEKWQLAYDCADSALRELSVTRSEAIKEFAERLENKLYCIPPYHFMLAQVLQDVKSLVNEMTEGKQ